MNRFGFPLLLAIASTSSMVAETTVKTFTYKTVNGLEIKADVHRSSDEVVRPVVVWIHGGALIMGGRQGVHPKVRDLARDDGYVLVSIDYRLAPETKLPHIISDLEDAFKWIRAEGPALFGADGQRIAVIGGSAGGYLALTAGFRVEPRPTALVSLYGYGDLVGKWYSTPSLHSRHQRMKISAEEAAAFEKLRPLANSRDRKQNGGAFYQYCRQHGLWPLKVSGWDPVTEQKRFVPYMPVRNIDARYPPTMLIHGTRDTDVPHGQSVLMEKELRMHKVPCRLISIENAEHGFGGGDPAEIQEAYGAMRRFVAQHLAKK